MNKIQITCCVILCIISACKKANDEIPSDRDLSKCQIQTFYFNLDSSHKDSIMFTYNTSNNPMVGLRSNVGDGAPNFIFRYDEHNRLKELIGLYDTANLNNIENWHNYSYDNYDRIIKDSLYYYPEIINGRRVSDKNVVIVSYEYDVKNRINKATTLFFGTTKIQTYTYDEKGNLGGKLYDDKINFHRTNKIWMFLSRDYSLNNPADAIYNYNDFNLPTNIAFPIGATNIFFDFGEGSIGYDVAAIKYSCKK